MNTKKKSVLLSLTAFVFALAGCGKEKQDSGSDTASGGNSSSSLPSSVSTSSTPDKEKYEVTFSSVEGATIALDHVDGRYEEGETVLVTVTVTNDTKGFGTLVSEEVTIGNIQNDGNVTTASFIRPKKNVVLTLTLKDVIKGHKVSQINNYSTDTFGEVSLKEGDVFEDGSKVTLTVNKVASDFIKENCPYYYIEINQTRYHPSFTESYVSSFSIEFTRPAEDVVINLSTGYNQIDDKKGYSVTLEENQYVSLLAWEASQKYTRFYGKLLRKAGYKVTSVKYRIGDGEWTANFSSFSIDNLCERFIYSITGNVTIKVEGEFTGTRKITYVNQDAISTTYKLYTEATEGDSFSVSFKASPKYTLTGKPTFTGVKVPDNDVTETYFKLTVADSDITITFPCKENGKITLLPNQDIKSCKIVNKTTKEESEYCGANAVFLLYPVTVDGKVVTSARTIDQDGNKGSYVYAENDSTGVLYLERRRPKEGDCSVELVTADGIVITNEIAEHGTLSLVRSTYRKGETVSFSVEPESIYYSFEKIINMATGEEIKTVRNGKSGTFVMPDVASLSIKAVFKEAAKATVTLEGYDSSTRTSVSGTGSQSHAEISDTKTCAQFLIGESISFYASLKSTVSDKTLHVYQTINGEETEVVKGYFSYSIPVVEGLTKIRLAAESNPSTSESYKATVIAPEGYKLYYVVNYGSVLNSLDGALIPDSTGKIILQIRITAPEGHDFQLQVFNDKGVEIKNEGLTSYNYTISSDITIKVVETTDTK